MIVRAGGIDLLPPSVNKLWIKNGFGDRVLSAAGRKWKALAQSQLSKQWMFEQPCDPTKPHFLHAIMWFPKVENSGWPKKAKNRFKKQDSTNYIKLFEDVTALCAGLDDSCTFPVHIERRHDPEFPRMLVILWELDADLSELEYDLWEMYPDLVPPEKLWPSSV
jgi:hypothetical protein